MNNLARIELVPTGEITRPAQRYVGGTLKRSPSVQRAASSGLEIPSLETADPTPGFTDTQGRPHTPSQRLCKAMLEGAVSELHDHNPKLKRQATTWVHSRDESYAFSFESVCHVLGLDPDATRERLLG